MKEKKKWLDKALNHPFVKEGLVELSDNGESFKRLLCDSILQTKHSYTFFRMTGSGGHESTGTHQRKVQARAISQQYDAKQRSAGKPVEKASIKKQKAIFEFKFSLQKMP
eukprot:4146700-Ditylum_brightwellii.AAC.1